MNIARRKFLQMLMMAGAAIAANPVATFAKEAVRRSKVRVASRLTIAQIVDASWPLLNFKELGWTHDKLIKMEAEGRIQYVPLAANYSSPVVNSDGFITERVFDVEQILVPVIWTQMDEARTVTEHEKISLVKALIENAINSHDDLLASKIPDGGKLILIKEYVRWKSEIHMVVSSPSYCFTVSTAFIILDKDGNQVKVTPDFQRFDSFSEAGETIAHDYTSDEESFDF